MSDVPQGPGWWQASDDKWYPPPRPAMPGDELAAQAPTTTPGPGVPPAGPPPVGPGTAGAPLGPPGAPPPGLGPPPGMAPSPYGGVPAAPPAGPNRAPLIVGLCVLAAAALVVLILVLTNDDGNGGPSAGTTTTAQPGSGNPLTPTTEAPGGGGGGAPATAEGVDVVEQGFTNFPAALDGTNHVTYAYVLENTTDNPVTDLQVTITLTDAGGTVLTSDSHSVAVLQPGARLGLGNEPFEEIGEVSDMEVQVGVPSYSSTDAEQGEVTVDGITTTTDDYQHKTTFTVSSSYGSQLESPYAYVVYRDGNGQIIGGSYGFLDLVPAGGSTSGEVTSYEVIPGIDPERTEVFIEVGYL